MTNHYIFEKEHLARILGKKWSTDVDSEDVTLVSDEGQQKLVFAAKDPHSIYTPKEILAIAMPRDFSDSLYEEFRKLKLLYKAARQFFPKPEFFFEDADTTIIAMELLPHMPVKYMKPLLREEDKAQLAENIGFATGFVYRKTGLFTEEPHDLNILCSSPGEGLEVKLIDADHFNPGSKKELMDIFLCKYGHDRDECVKHPRRFVKGLTEGHQAGNR